MLHAVYFEKEHEHGSWIISYKNRYVESKTFRLEKQRNKPGFLPALSGDASAVLAAILLNTVTNYLHAFIILLFDLVHIFRLIKDDN